MFQYNILAPQNQMKMFLNQKAYDEIESVFE